MIFAERVPAGLDGQRLDRVVAMIAGCSRRDAARWIDESRIQVDGVVVNDRAHRLRQEASVRIDIPQVVVASVTPDPTIVFDVVHADDDLIVIDKPAGLVVHPGAGHAEGTLVNGLLAAFPEIGSVGDPDRPGIVHRLDRGTSGLLVVARTSRAYTSLVAALAARTVHRSYAALVHGHPESSRGVIEAPIGRSPRDPTKMAVVATGKDARTYYQVIETFSVPVSTSRLQCRLDTGRTHQIRVHLAAIGHPVAGDTKYGGSGRSIGLVRPFLHAEELRFEHPVTGDAMQFTSPLPDDLTRVVAALGS